jgi:hypothetical protein
MNALLLILDHDELRYALVPLVLIKQYRYHLWDGQIVGRTKDNGVHEEIEEVFDRLGLEDGLTKRKRDLRKYLYRKPPFSDIQLVIKIGWVDNG